MIADYTVGKYISTNVLLDHPQDFVGVWKRVGVKKHLKHLKTGRVDVRE